MVVLIVLAGLIALGAVCALHRYVWRRVVRDTTAPRSVLRRVGTAVFVAGPLLAVAALVAERSGLPFVLRRALAWPGYLWLALALYLLLAVLVGELVRPLLLRLPPVRVRRAAPKEAAGAGRSAPVRGPDPDNVGSAAAEAAPEKHASPAPTAGDPRPRGGRAPAPGTSRRVFASRIIGGGAVAAAAGLVGNGTYEVLRGPRVKRLTVTLDSLPRSAHGFRIAVVSDLHLGPVLGRSFTRRVVDTVNSTQPDLVAVVGDLVDGSVVDLGNAAEPLSGLRPRHGSYFVTGNHEYYSGARQWIDHVRELGLRPLENDRTELAGFDLAGVNDVQGQGQGEGPDFERALGDRDPRRASVLLAHQPVVVHDAVRFGVDLQLSGHTHGGQLWPGSLIAALANPTVAGLDRYGDTQLYVTRGAGAWGPPVRVGAPSDITVVELAAADA